MTGKTISHYRILEKLGEGGMGVVYKAEDTKLKRYVALKFLPPSLTTSPAEKERFSLEAQAASALNHPNITTIYEIDEYEGQLFIAMELVEGRTLKELARSEPLPVQRVIDIAIQAAEGLAAAHDKGVVHRDIKSENFMITPKGQVKVMDFGLAKFKGAAKLTQTGSTPGTAAYMSPEQAQGQELDHRSDIFSFGIVLYELLAGRLPFRGEHQAALAYSIVNEEPTTLARFNEKVSEDLQRIVSKALAKDRGERYQHADDMLADLKRERKAIEQAGTAQPGVASFQTQTPKEVPSAGAGAAPVPSRQARSLLKFLVPVAIVLLGIALVAILNPFGLRVGAKRTAESDRRSVAVLPFDNMSDSKEDEYFSDGITDDIITQLSNISELRVISRTSVMQYKNTTKNLRNIAKELNVANILEGSVRREGNQVRIVAQLLDAKKDEHIWAQTYDREMTQIFAIQSDVARQIASALEAKLSPREKEQLRKEPTRNLDAYAYYLKGREYYYRYAKQDNETAIDLFKKAIQLDPGYALAYAGLGDAYAQRASRFSFPPAWADSSIAVSTKAVSLDPNLAEGYKALGLGYSQKGWTRKALEAYLQAVKVNPNYYPAISNLGGLYHDLGRTEDALAHYRKSLALNPTNVSIVTSFGNLYMDLGEDSTAVEWYNKALALQPDFVSPHLRLADMHIRRREYADAAGEALKALSLEPDNAGAFDVAGTAQVLLGDLRQAETYFRRGIAIDPVYGPKTQLGYVCWKTGRKDEARKWFARSIRDDKRQLDWGTEEPWVFYDLARINAIQGRKSESYEWLQKAVDGGWRDYRFGEIDPLLENLRGDTRFKRMMADIKTRMDEMRKRVEKVE